MLLVGVDWHAVVEIVKKKEEGFGYHWWEVPQVEFLSWQKFCCDKHVFVATKNVFCCDRNMLS